MRQIHQLSLRVGYAVIACLLIFAVPLQAQQGSQPFTLTDRNRTVADGEFQGATVHRTHPGKSKLVAAGAAVAKATGASQQVPNALTAPCTVNRRRTPTPRIPQLPECKYAARGEECMVKVDRSDLAAVGAQEVASGTSVHILVVHKSPFEKVRFESERKEVAPPPNPISGLISLLSGAAGGITGAKRGLASVTAGCTFPAPPPPYSDQRRLEAMIATLKARMDSRINEVETVRSAYDRLKEELNEFFGSDYCDANDPAHISGDFETERDRLVTAICVDVISKAPLSTEGEDQLLKDIGELFKKIVLDTSSYQNCINLEITHINEATGSLRLLREAIASLDDARKEFTDIRNKLIDLEGAQCFQDIRVVADRQADVVGNLIFTNVITGKDSDKKLFAKISFRDLPRAALSAGILISSLEKRKFAVLPVFDGAGVNPGDTVQNHLEIRGETSRPQVIPFTFVNVRLADWRTGKRSFTFNIAPGVGVNPNNGTTETEFALGPSLGVGSIYFFGGFHFGREPELINGFNPGDRVPANFTAPVGRSWKTGFGFGVSYRLPLP